MASEGVDKVIDSNTFQARRMQQHEARLISYVLSPTAVNSLLDETNPKLS